MLKPVKEAFGRYVNEWYASIVPTSKQVREFSERGLAKSIVWAPSRMVDAAEDMLASWRKNDTDSAPSRPPELPVIIVSMAKDFTQTMRDYSAQIADPVVVMLPDDAKERAVSLRVINADIRTQIAIFAHENETARALAAQLALFMDAPGNRRFQSVFRFGGVDTRWWVQIENPDAIATSVATESKNLTILAMDVTLKAAIPLFAAPKYGEPVDASKGGYAGYDEDPASYPVVTSVDAVIKSPLNAPDASLWQRNIDE